MDISGSLLIEVLVVVIVIAILLAVLKGIIRIFLILITVAGLIWGYTYITSPDFSADKVVKDLGKAVESAADMTPALLSATTDTLKTLKDVGAKTSFNENGLTFKGSKDELQGSIGAKNGHIRLYMEAPLSDESAVKSMISIASVFSGDKSISKTISSLAKDGTDQKVKMENGYAQVKGNKLILLREKAS